MSQSSIWVLDQPPEMHSLLRSSFEVAKDHEWLLWDEFSKLSYKHVIYIKKFLRSYWLQIWKKNVLFFAKKCFWTVFVKNHHFSRQTKFLTLIFFQGKSKNHKKWLYQRKVGMLIVKVKKFGVVWYIPFEMTAKSARGGTVQYPPSINRVKPCKYYFFKSQFLWKSGAIYSH